MKKLTLAMETAVGGGSLSISDGEREIDFWIGTREISKAEEVLDNIEKLLKKNGITKSEISTVAISVEFGSATGLKIGSAMAKGLAKGLESDLRSVSLIGALKESISLKGARNAMIALPFGKNSIHLQNFSNLGNEASSTSATVSLDDFTKLLQNNDLPNVYSHQSVFEMSSHYAKNMFNLGGNLAKYICHANASDNTKINDIIISHIASSEIKLLSLKALIEAENISPAEQFIRQIVSLQEHLNLSRWTAEDYYAEISNPNAFFLVAVFENEIIAFLIARIIGKETDLLNFGVSKSFQRQGIGKVLFGKLIAALQGENISAIWLEVRESNSNAVEFYTAKGFKTTHCRRNFYSHPTENGLVMKLNLIAEKTDET